MRRRKWRQALEMLTCWLGTSNVRILQPKYRVSSGSPSTAQRTRNCGGRHRSADHQSHGRWPRPSAVCGRMWNVAKRIMLIVPLNIQCRRFLETGAEPTPETSCISDKPQTMNIVQLSGLLVSWTGNCHQLSGSYSCHEKCLGITSVDCVLQVWSWSHVYVCTDSGMRGTLLTRPLYVCVTWYLGIVT
jgi:hypothetical protein